MEVVCGFMLVTDKASPDSLSKAGCYVRTLALVREDLLSLPSNCIHTYQVSRLDEKSNTT